uniref:Replication protein n=1 Tax=uncultured prokaryote TaxID=198431 RepID=A0A0H5QKY5_9ZZZZ|nr:hypothetical protein [uncultured prokaryote]
MRFDDTNARDWSAVDARPGHGHRNAGRVSVGARSAGPAREVGSSVANHAAARRVAWDALGWLHPRSALPSVQCCRRSTVKGEGVRLVIDSGTGRGAYSGLKTCGSVWACPVCSRAIWARRADQLTEVLTATKQAGGSALLVTLTMRHDRSQPLHLLWSALSAAWRSVKQSGAVRRTLDGLGGTITTVRRVEATHGDNGWHLHIHAIVLLNEQIDESQSAAIAAAYLGPWQRTLKVHGCAPSATHGVDVKLLDLAAPARAVAGYITARSTPEALAGELTDAMGGKRARQGNRTPWEILQAAMGGDNRSRALWHEWELASKGKRALDGLSRAMRALALGDEGTDEDAAATEGDTPDAITICALSDGTWRHISQIPLAAAALLEVAELHYAESGPERARSAVYAQIHEWRARRHLAPPGPPPGRAPHGPARAQRSTAGAGPAGAQTAAAAESEPARSAALAENGADRHPGPPTLSPPARTQSDRNDG